MPKESGWAPSVWEMVTLAVQMKATAMMVMALIIRTLVTDWYVDGGFTVFYGDYNDNAS